MKKVFKLLLPVLVFSACQTGPTDLEGRGQPEKITQSISLNGLDSSTAWSMIKTFQCLHFSDEHPPIITYVLTKKVIKHLYSLLQEEQKQEGHANQTSGGPKIDGVRIYFGCDPKSAQKPESTSLIFVSTRQGERLDTDMFRHQDYYRHNPADSLFQDRPFEIRESTPSKGALLFRTDELGQRNHEGTEPFTAENPHQVSSSDAQNRVQEFKMHPHAITTMAEWFDLDVFKRIAETAELDGIRIYISRRNTKVPKGAVMLENFLLVPVRYDPTQRIYIDLLSPKTGSGQPKQLFSSIEDNGELCPINCPIY